jgi:hypothetical protein
MPSGFLRLMLCVCGIALVTIVSARSDAVADRRPATSAGAKVRFSRDVQPIFDANCVTCHQTGGAQGNLILEAGVAYRATVSRPSAQSRLLRVSPGSPEGSYLFHKVNGTHLRVHGSGERMPTTGPLDRNSIEIIRKWISEGAKAG